VVFETFGLKRGDGISQAAVLPSDMTTSAMIFVHKHGTLSRDIGLSLVNPSATATNVTLTLRGEDGAVLATKTLPISAGQHSARLVTELFADKSSVPRDFVGTLRITSTNPIAIVGLRFRGLDFSTIPITNLSGSTPLPVVKGVGGPGALLLGQFAAGGGWESEVVISNPGSTAVNVQLDLFKSDGSPLTTRLNGKESSSFTGTVSPDGVLIFAPRDTDGNSRF
jgi:hypothetical protein